MRKHAGKKHIAILVVCLMIAQLLISGFMPFSAQADSPWPVSLPAGTLGDVMTHGDGSLSVVNGAIQSYNSAGLNINNSTPVDIFASSMFAAAGVDDTMYANYRTLNPGPSGGVLGSGIVAYKNNAKLWSYPFTSLCGSSSNPDWPYAKNVTLGYNNKLYAIEAPSCHSARLVILDASDGSLIQSLDLVTNYNNLQEDTSTRIFPFSSGARVLDGQTVKTYVDNATVLSDAHTYSLTGSETIDRVAGDSVGDVYVTVQTTGSGCSYGYTNRVIRMNIDGTQDSFGLSAGGCYIVDTIRVTPDKGFVLSELACAWGVCSHVLNGFAADGTKNYGPLSLDDWTGYGSISFMVPQVDSNGAVYVLRRGTQTSGDHNTNVEVMKIDSAGTVQAVFSTESLNANGITQVYSSASSWQYTELAIGELYIPLCGAACGGSNPTTLYKVDISSLGMDYPRNAVMASYSSKLDYVALGDSFSSGEGNPPFLGQSDTDGCHRSAAAYPEIIGGLSNVRFAGFMACSGATIADVRNGKNGESGQLAALDGATQLVTITVGGNDINFVGFATACVLSRCGSGTSAYNDVFDLINGSLQSDAITLFRQILQKAPGAELYVMGYPFLTPDTAGSDSNCLYLDPADSNQGIGSDAQGVRLVEQGLNGILGQAVDYVKLNDSTNRIHFIDPNIGTNNPFTGHDICSSEPYFQQYLYGTTYSYHPNPEGHGAYATVLLNGGV